MHVVQRGNNKRSCFRRTQDYRVYLNAMRLAAETYDVAVHAYVLMTNHVHLLLTPGATRAVSQFMQSIGRRYVLYFNSNHERTGTLWEGRFRSSIVDSGEYLLACYRYIELNPVRAGIVSDPSRYPWSSYHANALGREDVLLRPHDTWAELGETGVERCRAYRRLFGNEIDVEEIRRTCRREQPYGSDQFQERIEREIALRDQAQ